MQKLTDEYWYQFQYKKGERIYRDGQKFEDLTADLLACLYRRERIVFERTQTTHDGSKDFVGRREAGKLIWAECKNYAKSVSLTQVAPTLIMAELCDIDEILFFSYSKIAEITMKKLSRYARLKGKSLQIYDDDALESLILSLGSPILSKYFPTYREKTADGSIVKPYVFFALEKDPLFHPLTHEDEEARGATVTDLSDISIGTILSVSVSVVNRDAALPLAFSISFLPPSDAPDDLYCFTFLDERIKPAFGELTLTFSVAPGGIHSETIYLRYSKRRAATVFPPVILVAVDVGGTQVYQQKFTPPSIETRWTRKVVFSGSGYERIKDDFAETCVDCQHFGGLLLFGKSGTGKSRLLEECTSALLSKRYHVLNFTGWENTSTEDIVKELLCVMYNITGDMVLDTMTDDAENGVLDKARPQFRRVLALLKELNDGTVSKEKLESYFELIFEKLAQGGYTLVIDNLQNFDVTFLEFLKKMIRYGMNRRQSTRSLLLCSINLDQTYDDLYYEFIAEFNELAETANSRFRCCEAIGFQNEKQAVSFLASMLRLPVSLLDSPQIRETLGRCSLRPKYIEELADYLLQEGIVVLLEDRGEIPDPVLLSDALRHVPPEYERLFRARYRSFLMHCTVPDEQLELTLSMVHLIKPLEHRDIPFFGLSRTAVDALLNGGMLSCRKLHGHFLYAFEHDLMEQCMADRPEFVNTAIDFLVEKKELVYDTLQQRYPAQYYMCRFRDEEANQDEVASLCQALHGLNIPNNLEPDFYAEQAEWLTKMNERGVLPDEPYLRLATETCVHIRDFIGEVIAIPVFARCYSRVKEMAVNSPELLKLHFAFFIHYCENRNHMETEALFQENLQLYRDYLKRLSAAALRFPERDREIEYARDYIQNRMFVCGKHLGRFETFEQDMFQSIESSRKNQFRDVLFADYFDYSSALIYRNRDAALSSLECGLTVFEERPYPQFELNYYKKKIQYALIKGNLQELPDLFMAAFSCLKTSAAVKYHAYFRSCLLQLKVTWYLLSDAPEWQIRQALDDFVLSQSLLSKRNCYEVVFLEAKYAQRLHEPNHMETATALYRSALSKCRQSIGERESSREKLNCVVIEEELLSAVRALGADWLEAEEFALRHEISKDSWQILQMNDDEYSRYWERHRTSALVSGDGGREGFLL